MRNRSIITVLVLLFVAIGSCMPSNQPVVTTTSERADPDIAPVGATGLPAGYTGRADRADANLAEARYVTAADGWEVTTGPAHILYSASDVATGAYTARTTIEQLERPRHAEAFGLFIGGRDLDGPNQTYTYFVVRGSGEVLARVRQGDSVRTLVNWQRNPSIPVADSAGRARYRLTVQVASDSVQMRVNSVPVAAFARTPDLPVDGVVGLRINHNLHVRATPVSIERP